MVHHAEADLTDIRRRYSDVVLPFTQDNAKYDVRAFADLCTAARARGIRSWISPWGGRAFGGEGVDSGLQVGSWVNAALATGADGVHFDEPKVPLVVLRALVAACSGRLTMVSWEAERALDMAEAIPVDVVATEAYEPDPAVGIRAGLALQRITDRPVVVWAQGFRVPRGSEHVPGGTVSSLLNVGLIPGVWPWMGGSGRGVLTSDCPSAVQSECDRALDRAHRA